MQGAPTGKRPVELLRGPASGAGCRRAVTAAATQVKVSGRGRLSVRVGRHGVMGRLSMMTRRPTKRRGGRTLSSGHLSRLTTFGEAPAKKEAAGVIAHLGAIGLSRAAGLGLRQLTATCGGLRIRAPELRAAGREVGQMPVGTLAGTVGGARGPVEVVGGWLTMLSLTAQPLAMSPRQPQKPGAVRQKLRMLMQWRLGVHSAR